MCFFNSRRGYCTLMAINIFKYQSFKFHMVPMCVPMLNPMKIIQSKFLSLTVLNGLPCGKGLLLNGFNIGTYLGTIVYYTKISKQFLWKRYRSDSALTSMIIFNCPSLVYSPRTAGDLPSSEVLLYFRIQTKLVRWLLSVATCTSQIRKCYFPWNIMA